MLRATPLGLYCVWVGIHYSTDIEPLRVLREKSLLLSSRC